MTAAKKARRLPWLLGVAASAVVVMFVPPFDNIAYWQGMASPGPLSLAHERLGLSCSACHTPWTGIEARNCVLCHASDNDLLQRQPTSFHASVGSCRECHPEHGESPARPTTMDHVALAEIGLRRLRREADPDGDGPRTAAALARWIDQGTGDGTGREDDLAPAEKVLDCSACHRNEDPHFGLFGRDCSACHVTKQWALPAFRHPSPRSRDCSHCHQAPPSHYMEHFHMVSAKVAHQPHAGVAQCFLCHQTNSWNDIKGIGWYKHH